MVTFKLIRLVSFTLLILASFDLFSQESNNATIHCNKREKCYLYNKVNHLKTKKFDEVSDRYGTFFYCRKKKIASLYTLQGIKIIDTVRAITRLTLGHKIFQVISKNQIYWISTNGKILSTNPLESPFYGVCGTVPHYYNEVIHRGDSTYIKITGRSPYDELPFVKEISVSALTGKNELTYLNHSKTLRFTSNNTFKKNLDADTYFEKPVDGKVNIIQLKLNNSNIGKIVLLGNIDSIYTNTIETNFETFQPFIFKKNELFGYFPINMIEKYTSLTPFDGSFARFELGNGRKGWLDRNGNEYLDYPN